MRAFTFVRPDSVERAVAAVDGPRVRFVAGGTTLVDLMKLDVETPETIVDINALPLAGIEREPDGGLRIGALARNSDVAHHADVKRMYPMLSEALLAGASVQLRNMATTGGNLLQRTRCVYFRDIAMPCNKREPDSGCSAIGGYNRNLAILGVSDHCIAANPSDQNVALTALDAIVDIESADGNRSVPITGFFVEPGATPQRETVLQPGDLITAVRLPAPVAEARSTYLKLRDRASYEFALVSAAVEARISENVISHVRIALGGVGTIPWRCSAAEMFLIGQPPSRELFAQAALLTLRDARPQSENAFKIELARRCVVQALSTVTSAA